MKHPLHKFRPGSYAYRGFNIHIKAWHWQIIDADGEGMTVLSLKAAMKKIDNWYTLGLVE